MVFPNPPASIILCDLLDKFLVNCPNAAMPYFVRKTVELLARKILSSARTDEFEGN